MSVPLRAMLILVGIAILGAGGTWWWYENMERAWTEQTRQSDAARLNRMLAASMLLRQDGRTVTVAGSYGELPSGKLPDGTLILADASGLMEQAKADRLLAWVERGNTLIAQPRWLNAVEEKVLAAQIAEAEEAEAEEAEGVRVPAEEAEGVSVPAEASEDASVEELADDEPTGDDEHAGHEHGTDDEEAEKEVADDLVENDPIAARLGVRLFEIPYAAPCADDKPERAKRCKPAAKGKHAVMLRRVVIGGAGHGLLLDADRKKLIDMPDAAAQLWADDDDNTLRVYQEGKGKIVMLAADFFSNDALRNHDHGELLLALARLNGASKHVMIVQNLEALPWHKLLWKNYNMALLSLAALIALLFWAGVRRFGPLLPEPVNERRSLMEHIDASGAWLWKAKDGRQLLLDAAREDTLALIRRRAPGLFRLSDQELCAALARLCKLPADQVAQALHQAAAPTSLHFTRQIRILQELRNHHER